MEIQEDAYHRWTAGGILDCLERYSETYDIKKHNITHLGLK
jgi:hypothetical protein